MRLRDSILEPVHDLAPSGPVVGLHSSSMPQLGNGMSFLGIVKYQVRQLSKFVLPTSKPRISQARMSPTDTLTCSS